MMKVIIAGLPNTGAEAVEEALVRLGYNVYGRAENCLELTKEWNKVLNENGTIEDIKNMFRSVDAVADIPACYFWEEILQAYPDAKIVFTKHPCEQDWVEETAAEIKRRHSDCEERFLNMSSPTMSNVNAKVVAPIERILYGFTPPSPCSQLKVNKSLLRKRYRGHNAHVLENAPKEQLLIYDVSEGWKPLCNFLGVTPPSSPFPTVKDSRVLAKKRMENNAVYIKAKNEQKITVSLFVVAVSTGIFKLVKSPPAVLERACEWLQKTISSVFGKNSA